MVRRNVTEGPSHEVDRREQASSATQAASVTGAGRPTGRVVTEPDPAEVKARRMRVFKDAARELLLVALLFGVYKLGRGLASGETATAFSNAKQLLTMQQDLRLPDEAAIQDWFMQSHAAVTFCNKYYAYVHFPATVGFLLWLWIRHREHYKWVRNILAMMTGAALVIHILVPLAPPRKMPGFTDTGMDAGDSPYSGAGAKIANQFAAMPSLHVGWAVVLALGVASVWHAAGTGRRVASWAVWLHPAITLMVVVVTANHYWMDAVVAVLLMIFALAVLPGPDRDLQRGLIRAIPAPRIAR